MKGQSLEQRMAQLTAPPDENGCRIWKGALNGTKTGGLIRVNGKTEQARRVAYELAYGPINAVQRMFVVNKCQNQLCVTPEHLHLSALPNQSAFDHAGISHPLEQEETITADGETKTLTQWMLDPRVKASRATIKSRLWWIKKVDEHNKIAREINQGFDQKQSRENPWGYMTTKWDYEHALFTPARNKRSKWHLASEV